MIHSVTNHSIYRLFSLFWKLPNQHLPLKLVITMGSLVLARVSIVMTLFIYRDLINQLLPQILMPMNIPFYLLFSYGGLQLFAAFFQECRDYFSFSIIKVLNNEINHQTLYSIFKESNEFHHSKKTGILITQLDRGLRAIETIFSMIFTVLLPGILEIILISLAIAWLFPWYFVCIILMGTLTYAIFMWQTGRFLHPKRLLVNLAHNQFQHAITESLTNNETVTLFNQELFEQKRLEQHQHHYQQLTHYLKRWQNIINLSKQSILILIMLTLMWLSAKQIALHQTNIGDFIILHFLLGMMIQPIQYAGSMYHSFKQGIIHLNELQLLMNKNPKENKIILKNKPRGEIIFDHVQFNYPEKNQLILDDFNLFIPAGESVAIMGTSGVGKSTLIKLLLGYYAPQKGRIMVDGKPLTQLQCQALRNHCGVVNQHIQLFHQTIAENIAYGNPQATQAEIKQAAMSAALHEDITCFPEGYQTVIGEQGMKLSGGQRQRIAIARALLRKPSIFIFDEATSLLDIETENAIMQTISQINQGITTLFITHRAQLANFATKTVNFPRVYE